MNVLEALKSRKSVRAFIDKDVDDSIIEKILEHAKWTPSGTNTQPWKVAVVKGKTKAELDLKLKQAFESGVKKHMDYNYYPTEWKEPYINRRVACGMQLYGAVGIERFDKPARLKQWAANYNGFGAPVMMLFFMDGFLEKGSFMDNGMFIQSVMLAAEGLGLSTCPQAAMAEYPSIIKEHLGYAQDIILLCGMAIGYEDSTALINGYRTEREDVKSFTQFFD